MGDTNPASTRQCYSCEYWEGNREYKEPGYIAYDGQFAIAKCRNPQSVWVNTQVQPIHYCDKWGKWYKIP